MDFKFFIAFSLLLCETFADTPANCTYEDLEGLWHFKIGKGGQDAKINCDTFDVIETTHVTLTYPDLASDEYGNKGFWTLIYNQGFEVVIHGRKYFAFSKYTSGGASVCDETMPGWSHNVLGKDWACFSGSKGTGLQVKEDDNSTHDSLFTKKYDHVLYETDVQDIQKINSVQNLWFAYSYPEFQRMTVRDMVNLAGGEKSKMAWRPRPKPITEKLRKRIGFLPSEFDWRDVDGVNYVSPVRNQGSCGSCYAFSSMGMLESRLRILSNNSIQAVLSPQDVVECSRYSQGCDGGFPYLVAGKYAEDYGTVLETCNPYTGKDSKTCHTTPSCSRVYATRYQYVGGYYGGCNEAEMMLAVYNNGPVSISFEATPDFMHYKGGIYGHTSINPSRLKAPHFNPFELTNHAVLLIGWGEENGVPFWIVKNSWGATWGEKGYFRILRGVDELSIESLAVEAFPVF